ncbi:hypothetical protein Focb16_v014117 [Fusarium oxysporum f. sp. cubense]|uniref:F-box domain-containing protein n=1 Tax=Fusarium oxysporum f. sp. cubense TaxID=61366 RepID=A0A559KPB8_FUSOC|nr:hypothetical protein Focb16_v014117 [Fusarium oxysporum f. sp. cubense]
MATTHDAISAITDDLPPELIGHVFSWFCAHCSGCDKEDEDNTANVKVLLALTQTSRGFRSIAMPILFHSLGPHLPSTYFFRVADCQPDLAHTEFCSGVRNITEFQILGLPFFTGSWQILALERILGAAQKLKMFKFVSDGYSCWHSQARSQVSPTQLIEFLSPRTQKALQRRSLNFDGRVEPGQRNLPKPKPITPQQIKHFTNLTIFKVDSSCFYSHVLHHNKDELIVEQETYLVDCLPQTVQTLTIFFDRWARYELLHFITYLGQRVVSGDLPKLKRVQIDAPIRHTMPGSNSWDDDWDNEQLARLSAEMNMNMRREALQEAFVASGAEMWFKTWYIWEEGW